MTRAVRGGVAGLGYWGPNLARNLAAAGLHVVRVLDALQRDLDKTRRRIDAAVP